MADRFDDAVAALYSSLHQARTPEALRQSTQRRTKTVKDMQEYLQRIQLPSPGDLPVNVIHIAGTKGKGSTACMCEAIMRERYHFNTGMFTSPHLVDIRERIRVNGKPISKAVFSDAYWQVRQLLDNYKDVDDDLPVLPGYFRMMTLLALYVFSHYEPRIDVMILEVGLGGRYDATNVLDMDQRNVVCGVSLLDFDHVRVLGNTIEQIAWEKGGIFQVKKGSTDVSKRPSDGSCDALGSTIVTKTSEKFLFAVDSNTSAASSVLRKCAAIEGRGNMLCLVSEGQSLDATISLGLEGDHQRINAELAISLCESLVEHMKVPPMSDRGLKAMYAALENVTWPGRCQSVEMKAVDGTPIHFLLDGAHTPKSLDVCLKWFLSATHGGSMNTNRVLIFNCSHERDPVELIQQLVACQPAFDTIYFCRADFERPSIEGKPSAQDLLERKGMAIAEAGRERGGESISWQDTLADIWRSLETTEHKLRAKVFTKFNARDTVDQLQNLTNFSQIDILVTGSLYVVGSVLDALQWSECAAFGSLASSRKIC